MMMNKTVTLAELADKLQATYHGDPKVEVSSLGPIKSAGPGQVTFVDNPRYRRYLSQTKASIVIISELDVDHCPTNALVVDNPYYAYAKVAQWFYTPNFKAPGIHPTAVVAPTAEVDDSVHLGAHVVIGEAVKIGANVIIEAGTVVGDGSSIGCDTRIYPNVTLYHDVHIGARVIIHSGAVIGSDGFGIAKHKGVWHKVPQVGGVLVGDDVEIGASTTIDRGAMGDTVIEEDVKLDNQIQVAHNVRIGAHTAVAGCTGIAGSVTIGKDCLIGGSVGIGGHLKIADNVAVLGQSGITKTISESGVYSSTMPAMPDKQWKRCLARFRQLDKLFTRIKHLEERDRQGSVLDEEAS